MRFKSMLLLWLLFVGSLAAQPPCDIFDLSATISTTNPQTAPCQYFVQINFGHTGTTNQFTIFGNGNNYGTFTYGQLPVTLGPFTAGATSTTREFLVKDAVLTDCFEDVGLNVPGCSSGACEITNVQVETGDCHPNSLSYEVSLNYQVLNATNALVDVWAGNGTFLGSFPASQQPLLIPNFPWGGANIDHLKICVQGNLDCCKSIEFPAPNCLFVVPCGIDDLTVVADSCTSDTSYRVKINFQLLSTTPVDSFKLYANNSFWGTYALGQLPLTIPNFPWGGGTFDVVKICVELPNGQECCKSKEFAVPGCLNPCGIKNLSLITDTCNTDSTFRLKINFDVNSLANLDSFQVWGNGDLLGTYALSALPLWIEEFPWNGNVFQQIRICTENAPACCIEKVFVAPDCLPFGPCEITDIFTQVGACTSDSTYKVRIGFQATNPGNGTFTLWVNGNVFGTYPLTANPLQLDSFPWGGNNQDVIKICVNASDPGNAPCCRNKEIQTPPCLQDDPCEIFDLSVQTGDCIPGTTLYSIKINFQVQNPGNQFFEVFTIGGVSLGTFPLNQLPLTIPNFPGSGNAGDAIKVCINDQPNCCKVVDFPAPCQQGPCEIFNLSVQTGDCIPGTLTYQVTIDFDVQNPGNQSFKVFTGAGQNLGTFLLSQLPLTLPFPGSGNANDVIKICIVDHPDCCKVKEFPSPCSNQNPCEIFDLTVQTGDCLPGTPGYSITINFQVQNPGNQFFEVFTGSGQNLGTYPLNQLPLTLVFPASGNPFDVIKVCINDQPNCCKVKEFQAPNCGGGNCEINNLSVQTGQCTSDSTYQLWVNFTATNAPGNIFGVWANGVFQGVYNLNQLPLQIPNFPWNGGANDVIKVCLISTNSTPPVCCETLEFAVPDCLADDCEIVDLSVQTGDCTGDSTYVATINFVAINPPANTFGIWANGVFQGTYNLNQLPVTIQNFPWNGGNNDLVKVCFIPNVASGSVECCKFKEFQVPACLTQGNPCAISGLVVDTGDCTSDSTYQLSINFTVSNPPGNQFGVWANNEFLGLFNLNQLPLTIQNFPWNGGNNDLVKVCFGNGGILACCAVKEFEVPDCLGQGGNCEIYNFEVEAGDCTSDSTYKLWLNFQVNNPPADQFGVWANGEFLGTFGLNQLPLVIPNFPYNGGANDVVKVCFLNNVGSSLCCAIKEFSVPDCLNGDCHIWDLTVQKTPCVCGQFFAILSFQHDNGGAGGYSIFGNGVNYGNFAYNTQQPIILGPLDGDGTTAYEFIVKDLTNPDCKDAVELGIVLCSNFVTAPTNNGKLVLSPNPAADWIQVTAQMSSGAKPGTSRVDIYHADGRLVQQQTIADGASFQLNISQLPAGMYRMLLQTEAGLLEGTFAKQ